MKPSSCRKLPAVTAIGVFLFSATSMVLPRAAAAGPPGDGDGRTAAEQWVAENGHLTRPSPDSALAAHDAATQGMVISEGPFAEVIKNLAPSGRGERFEPDATTDVWVLGKFAYTGTFNSPCGGEPDAGIWIWDVHNHNKIPERVGFIPSPAGSRANDVKVAQMNSGNILVHTNESCAGGPGGFEIWEVSDPTTPMHLASVQVDELNPISDALFGGLSDVGVHNVFLFTQGEQDLVAAVSEGAFDNFQVFDITDPTNPALAGAWGAEEIFDPGVGDETTDVGRVLNAALWLLDGFGSSANRFLHDITISEDGARAYLSNWDAGLVLLDIGDPSNPTLVGVADPTAGPGGEGNSHAAWPTADGSVVVETTEDFEFQRIAITVNTGPLASSQFGGTEDVGGAPPPRFADTGPVTGELVFVGRLCTGDPVENAGALDPGDIAVIRRGACIFSEKLLNAQALGAGAGVIANNVPGGEVLGNWTAPDPAITIPGLFISTADGDTIEGNPTGNLATIDPDVVVFNPWGFVRIWDFSDPMAPVLASTFLTEHAENLTGPPDPRGTFSVHNVIVEDNKAYISWYSDGVLIVDISDPYSPVEVARFHREGPQFEAENGGIQDVWGIYKEKNLPWIYASDRNGGLYVLKEYGQGTIGKK